jgi:Spy/CpxP family protein refolding chaperone
MTRTKGMVLTFYLAAAVAGVALGVALDRYMLRDDAPWTSVKAMRDRFAKDLKLTVEQRASVDNILDARFRAESILVVPIRPQLDSLRGEARLKISAVLTPEQQRVYEQMQRDQKSRAQEKKQQ